MLYYLGPRGSFTEKAGKVFSKLTSLPLQPTSTIYEIFENVDKNNAYGVVPSENSIEGSVTLTQDLLLEYDVKILGEVDIDINHNLVGYNKDKIEIVISHPQALAQCRKYIKEHGWKTKAVSSTAKAAEIVAKKKDERLGAIASIEAAKLYGLKVLDRNIQDYKNNKTRFILIGKKTPKFNAEPIAYKTTIIIELKEDRPGALYHILKKFAERNINLTRIESRPSKKRLGVYVFYIDFESHGDEKELFESLNKNVAYMKYLGTYPVFRKYI
ncbi:prephenate dehydratase [Methanotorris formicicus]|uniref:prephenate dehydratase n=1 Tax=Methanotorris formicicus Mc-S-70 TaxID=647171 RepID=H1L1J2_9EURY|nr:prephenate dehydratase [Methanotorris formicicus]EHP83679.1 Prephenate dehydratase [Methanotorris formicicus Mc-S-70]